MSELPTLSVRAALKAGVTHFLSPFKCKECGSKERICYGRSESDVLCATCFPPETEKKLTLANINSDQNKHNRAVGKLRKKNWGIPVVFSGMNTI